MARKNIKNWDTLTEEDDFERFGKMRRREKKSSRAAELQESFEEPEERWAPLLQSDGFAARVVEVHKRYAFVSPEPQLHQIETRDVWLATVARKFLQAKKAER